MDVQPPATSSLSLSVVLPCLNEEESLGRCLQELQETLSKSEIHSCEVIVADNGSTDRSVEIALGLGARVVRVPERGYGHALAAGIASAKSQYVAFMDADGTYPVEKIPELFCKMVSDQAALGLVSRLDGTIEKGAMPWAHRWIGTPILTRLINLLYGAKLTDCGTGLRCVRRDWFFEHPHHSGGMEFASENLIRALKSGARVVEVRGGLRQGPPGRQPHLQTWRDGMRHLMFILSERPALFERSGLSVALAASVLQIAAVWHGPWRLGIFDIFGLHTQILALLAALLSTQVYFLGVLFYTQASDRPAMLTTKLINLPEDHLFFTLLGACCVGAGAALSVLLAWWGQHFSGLSTERWLLAGVHFIVLLGTFCLGLLGVRMACLGGERRRLDQVLARKSTALR